MAMVAANHADGAAMAPPSWWLRGGCGAGPRANAGPDRGCSLGSAACGGLAPLAVALAGRCPMAPDVWTGRCSERDRLDLCLAAPRTPGGAGAGAHGTPRDHLVQRALRDRASGRPCPPAHVLGHVQRGGRCAAF